MVIKNETVDDSEKPIRVSLTPKNWAALVGMMLAWVVFVGGAFMKLENRLARLEVVNEYLIKQIDRLENNGKRP